MRNDKKKKDIDKYLKEMMGTFTEEQPKEAVRHGLRNLGFRTPKEKPKEVE